MSVLAVARLACKQRQSSDTSVARGAPIVCFFFENASGARQFCQMIPLLCAVSHRAPLRGAAVPTSLMRRFQVDNSGRRGGLRPLEVVSKPPFGDSPQSCSGRRDSKTTGFSLRPQGAIGNGQWAMGNGSPAIAYCLFPIASLGGESEVMKPSLGRSRRRRELFALNRRWMMQRRLGSHAA
jgi:hypothetical protein